MNALNNKVMSLLFIFFTVKLFKPQQQRLHPLIQINMSTNATSGGPIEQAITSALIEKLQPIHLEVVNESYMHNVPKGSETHFKVLVVSNKFESLPLIKVCWKIYWKIERDKKKN